MTDGLRGPRLAGVLVVAAVYCVALWYLGGLSFDPIKDEAQFWVQAVAFAEDWPPSIAALQSYQEPMTPVSFLLWGALENTFHLGIAAGRLVNLVAALLLLALIGSRRPLPGVRREVPVMAALGLLVYPYWVPMSLLAYTDVLASLFVVLGLWAHMRERYLACTAMFVLAIATRQYMVVFPAAIVVYEVLEDVSARRIMLRRWLPALVATASMFGWYAFFGGTGPAEGLANWPRHQRSLWDLTPEFSLYFVSAIGAYFVVPEFAIDRRWRSFAFRVDTRLAVALIVLALGFVFFTPNYPSEIGPLNQAITFVLVDPRVADIVRPVLLFGLACVAVARFIHMDLAGWLVVANVVLMSFLWAPWEKYCMPLMAALWYLKSEGLLHGQRAVSSGGTTDSSPPDF
ncbi:MAG: hypothetical protein GY944_20510 [bacterium]|nr:hypothetical protein [bacterium]